MQMRDINFTLSFYSAGQRDRGKNVRPLAITQMQRPNCQGQGGAEGPDAGSLTEEGAEGPRRLSRNKRPLGKTFSTKVEN